MEGSVPASEAEPGTLQATLAATPGMFTDQIHYIDLHSTYSNELLIRGAPVPTTEENSFKGRVECM